jgi:betaine-aldehyde dehydrogenase
MHLPSQKTSAYINGEWQDHPNHPIRAIINPATQEELTQVIESTPQDVATAVMSARKYFDENWYKSRARDRAELLFKMAQKLSEQQETFAIVETLNNGKTLREARYDIQDAINQLQYYAGLCTKPMGQTYEVPDDIQAMVVREPMGVIAQIVPWNYPLVMAIQKIAPAFAAGCAIVIKPAEQTPLSLIKFFEIIDAVACPKGAINLVLGDGASIGSALVQHPEIDKIAFTGGSETGSKIMKMAADGLKKVGLELGGKSPNIMFDDVDEDLAIDFALFGIFANQGQVCSAGSRLIIQESLAQRIEDQLKARAEKIVVGNGLDPHVEMGPLISKTQLNRVINYIEIGKNEGATLLCGGYALTPNQSNQAQFKTQGFFLAPTIFSNTHPDMRIVQEEIFGPVLVIQTFKTEEEAIRLANHSKYGLAGAVFTKDVARAHRVIKRLRAGITWINNYHPTFNEAPWGGYKQSGIGRELGTFGLEAYLEVKQINISLNPQPSQWFKG